MSSNHTFGVTSSDPFGVATTDFILVGLAPTNSLNVAIADNATGEYVTASQKSYGERRGLAASYKAVVITAIADIEIAAGAGTAAALESVSISTAKGTHATGSAKGHEHVGGTNANHNTRARTVTIPGFSGFGSSLFGLSVGVPAASIQSATYTVELGHTDAEDKNGNFLAGIEHGEKHTVSFDAIDETTWTVPEGWVASEKTNGIESNNQFVGCKLTLSKYVDYVAPE